MDTVVAAAVYASLTGLAYRRPSVGRRALGVPRRV